MEEMVVEEVVVEEEAEEESKFPFPDTILRV